MIMGVAAIFGMFAGTFFWFPKMFGRMMNETLGKIHFCCTFVGVYAIFMPMHFLGHRRQSAALLPTSRMSSIWGLMPVHTFMTHAAFFTAAAQFIFLFNLFWSMKKGGKRATGIRGRPPRWSGASRRRRLRQLRRRDPVVNHGPYEYSVPGRAERITSCKPIRRKPTRRHSASIWVWPVTHTRHAERPAAAAGRPRLGRRRWRRRTDGAHRGAPPSPDVGPAGREQHVFRRLDQRLRRPPRPLRRLAELRQAAILWVEYGGPAGSSIFLDLARRALKKRDRSQFNRLVDASATVLGYRSSWPARRMAWRQLQRGRGFRLDQPRQLVLLRSDRVARLPPVGRRDRRWCMSTCRRCACNSARPSAPRST